VSSIEAGDLGDVRAFEELFAVLCPQVRSFARRHVAAAVVDDVVSETFLTVWRRFDTLPEDEDARRAWVFMVARFAIAHAQRDAGRTSRRVARLAEVAVPGDTLVEFRQVEETDVVLRALAVLPPAERQALELLVIEGCTAAEAAERLGCSLTAVSSRVSRARRRLELASSGVSRVEEVAAGER
jgi:RNA polymerase sigma-70 factor (ECF subfamily)